MASLCKGGNEPPRSLKANQLVIIYREISIALYSKRWLGLTGDEGLPMYTRDLKHALTQPYVSTSRAFTMVFGLWSPREKVKAQFPLCTERRVYKCKLYNG